MLTWGMAVFLNENRSFGGSCSWHSGFDVCIIFRRKLIKQYEDYCCRLGQMKYWFMLFRELASLEQWHKIKECQNDQPWVTVTRAHCIWTGCAVVVTAVFFKIFSNGLFFSYHINNLNSRSSVPGQNLVPGRCGVALQKLPKCIYTTF